jgi:heat shock protein HtpX
MFKNQLKTILLLGSLSVLLVGVGALVAPSMLTLFAGLAVLMNIGAYFFSDRLVLRMHRAAEVDSVQAPGLHAMVQGLATAAGIPKPRIFLVPEDQPNAFATGRNPAHGVVAVTQGLMSLLDERELRGVLAHEIAHIKNRDILIGSIAATMAGILAYVGQALSFGALFGGGNNDDEETSHSGGLLAAIVAPLAGMLVQMAISRSREFMADETGARISGDPQALASALQKLERGAELIPAQATPATASLFIVNPLGAMERLSRLFSTHPNTEERVRRLMAMVYPAHSSYRRSMHGALWGES